MNIKKVYKPVFMAILFPMIRFNAQPRRASAL